jgi:hypothetical protein
LKTKQNKLAKQFTYPKPIILTKASIRNTTLKNVFNASTVVSLSSCQTHARTIVLAIMEKKIKLSKRGWVHTELHHNIIFQSVSNQLFIFGIDILVILWAISLLNSTVLTNQQNMYRHTSGLPRSNLSGRNLLELFPNEKWFFSKKITTITGSILGAFATRELQKHLKYLHFLFQQNKIQFVCFHPRFTILKRTKKTV